MSRAEIILAVVLGLLVNEACDLSPWLAKRLVRWSAHRRYRDPARADSRARELVSLIEERPGKLLKLITALGFAWSASLADLRRSATERYRTARVRVAATLFLSGLSLSDMMQLFLGRRTIRATWSAHWALFVWAGLVLGPGIFVAGGLWGFRQRRHARVRRDGDPGGARDPRRRRTVPRLRIGHADRRRRFEDRPQVPLRLPAGGAAHRDIGLGEPPPAQVIHRLREPDVRFAEVRSILATDDPRDTPVAAGWRTEIGWPVFRSSG